MSAAAVRRSTAFINFESVLEAGGAWIQWVDDAEGFQSIIKSKISWGDLDGKGRDFVQRRLREPQPPHQVLLNSLYLTMASSFEEFLRSTIEQAASEFFGGNKKYEDLSEVARNLHLREAAKLLRRLDSMPDYLSVTAVDLCNSIGSCVPGSEAVEVCAEALGDVDGLIRLKNFFDRMGSLGKEVSFDSLGRNLEIAAALKLEKSKARAVGHALESCVSQISKNRNRIAHTGGTAADVTRVLLVEHRSVLKAVAKAISAL